MLKERGRGRKWVGRMGIDANIRAYILADLSSASTIISVGKDKTRSINIKRGVKQGDPLSPILFNLVLDELLDEINGTQYKGTIPNTNIQIGAMAFADDIIILLDTEAHGQLQLDRIAKFLGKRGMTVNP